MTSPRPLPPSKADLRLPHDPSHRLELARRALAGCGQDHVLQFVDRLDDAGRDRLLHQIETVDWKLVAELIESHVRRQPRVRAPKRLEPAPIYPHPPQGPLVAQYARARAAGDELIRKGAVAVFTVAGGQGTRLGWDGPKGTFPATPIRRLPLFGCLAEQILKVRRKYAAEIPWYIMTSPVNDEATRVFLRGQEYFGLDPAQVMIFPQGMMPAFDKATARVLLEAPDRLALSPNGHGGALRSIADSGALDDMKKRGIDHISYTQVDNPNVTAVDPLFIGLHALDGCEMSSKAVAKTDPDERVGVFCLADGKVTVIEYSDMDEIPGRPGHERLEDGTLRFHAGSIAIHVIRCDFVRRLCATERFALEFHRAEKKVPYLDPATGHLVQPKKNNAVKLEMFVFDALPLCKRSIVYETDRIDQFAPIKNADAPRPDDSVDSPRTSRNIQIERAARWLEARGVKLPRDGRGRVDATLEISALTAVEQDDLKAVTLPESIDAGEQLLL
jgi:UDP-N-acetylglucosamine/UDP-N-acetylgalactosamine diphosphorylase